MAERLLSYEIIQQKTVRNQIFIAITDGGMQPPDFLADWTKSCVLTLPRTLDYFDLGSWKDDTDTAHVHTVPGGGGLIKTFRPGEGHYYQLKARLVKLTAWVGDLNKWLKVLDENADVPDLWAAVQEQSAFVQSSLSQESDNHGFSAKEIESIAARLIELGSFINANSSPTDARKAAERVEGHLKYLEDAANRLGRKDWLNILLAVLVNLAVAGFFAPNRMNELFEMARILFQEFYRTMIQLG